MMFTRALTILCASAVLALAGCGGGGGDNGPPPPAQIFSDPNYDGDIEQTSPGVYNVTQGMSGNVQSILAGIDPSAGTEFRSFLDFPLDSVPAGAAIQSAYLEIYIDDLQPPNTSLPLRVELVSFQPPNLVPTDFDRNIQPPLAAVTISPPINEADVGTYVSIDVTDLMRQAQRSGLPDFQVRIMEDLGPAISTLISIDDSTAADRSKFAPLLTVNYY